MCLLYLIHMSKLAARSSHRQRMWRNERRRPETVFGTLIRSITLDIVHELGPRFLSFVTSYGE